jgi:hypothetical protein
MVNSPAVKFSVANCLLSCADKKAAARRTIQMKFRLHLTDFAGQTGKENIFHLVSPRQNLFKKSHRPPPESAGDRPGVARLSAAMFTASQARARAIHPAI